jgi:hypothetical protein
MHFICGYPHRDVHAVFFALFFTWGNQYSSGSNSVVCERSGTMMEESCRRTQSCLSRLESALEIAPRLTVNRICCVEKSLVIPF